MTKKKWKYFIISIIIIIVIMVTQDRFDESRSMSAFYISSAIYLGILIAFMLLLRKKANKRSFCAKLEKSCIGFSYFMMSTLIGTMIVANLFDAGIYDTEFIRLIALFGIACMAIGFYTYKPDKSSESESEPPKDES